MDFSVKNLGERTVSINKVLKQKIPEKFIVSDDQRVIYDCIIDKNGLREASLYRTFELAGPREKIYFEPEKVRCAVVTCGGLCPGLNDVIRSVVMESWYVYGCRTIYGIRYGYSGLKPDTAYPPVELTPEMVRNIHLAGGTILGSSRGGADDLTVQTEQLRKMGVSVLYCIGGDGTLRGAHRISEIAESMGYPLSVIGIPKTIDNDISCIQRSFGFETAYSEAVKAIYSAHIESQGMPNGIGLVKLMGRYSGFIAAYAALAMNDVNFLLVPEVPFDLEGPEGLLAVLEARIRRRGHAVICAAEGAGQDLIAAEKKGLSKKYDASGNAALEDIGLFLKEKIAGYFAEKKIPVSIKYIDPSYMIRSAPACPADSIYCGRLGQYAVHAGMAGKTDCVIGKWNDSYIHIPVETAVAERKQIDPDSLLWHSALEATGQPSLKNRI